MSSGYNSCGSSSHGINEASSFPCSSAAAPSSALPPGPAIPIISDPRSGDSFASWLMPTTETTLRTLQQYLESYRHYVAQNPVWVSEVESALYWVSYLLSTTRFHNSRIVSELLYSCSSLLTLFNDTLLRKSYSIDPNLNAPNVYIAHLQTILSFIEYTQVFLELTALQMYGRYGKWIIISIVEIVKALIRLVLLLYFNQGLTRRQYLLPLNRVREFELFKMRSARKEHEQQQQSEFHQDANVEVLPDADQVPEIGEEAREHATVQKAVELVEIEQNAFKLPSSGRLIRNIDSAPKKSKRLWITPQQTVRLRRLLKKHNRTSPSITQLNRRRIVGELLHILRPIAHLAAGAVAGGLDKWSPYALSFSLDLVSLRLLKGSNFTFGRDNMLNLIMRPSTGSADDPTDPVDEVWNWSEQAEIQRRYMSLFMYLLRSPFYDHYTKERLLRLLSAFANHIPLFGRLLRPFIGYLPEWQRVYFYVWNQ